MNKENRKRKQINIYFYTSKELDIYKNLINNFMIQNKLEKKSEAIKQMLVKASWKKDDSEEFQNNVLKKIHGMIHNQNLIEMQTRFLVNGNQQKNDMPGEIIDALEKQEYENKES